MVISGRDEHSSGATIRPFRQQISMSLLSERNNHITPLCVASLLCAMAVLFLSSGCGERKVVTPAASQIMNSTPTEKLHGTALVVNERALLIDEVNECMKASSDAAGSLDARGITDCARRFVFSAATIDEARKRNALLAKAGLKNLTNVEFTQAALNHAFGG